MSARRFLEVFRQDLAFNARRPMFWVMLLLIGFMAFMLSRGNASISSGDARVGGTKAWITSEFALSQLMILMTSAIYVFFISVGAGMSLIRDGELKVGELLHSTPLTPGEYVWGKFASVLASFVAVLAIHVGLMMLFNHVMPHGENIDVIGPFQPLAYLRAAFLWALPTIVLMTGSCFALGALTRQPVLVFVGPIALLMGGLFFLWDWSPAWLSPAVNQILMMVDLTGLRWMKETHLLVDRGVEYYNHTPVRLDTPILIQRVVCAALGLASVWVAQRSFAARLRGAAAPKNVRAKRGEMAAAATRTAATEPALLSTLVMRSGAPGFWSGAWEVARVELRELRSHPGLYLFVPLILIQVLANDFGVGAFDTPLLNTAGTFATMMMNSLTLLICMLILFYTTESLQRERSTGLGAIYYATPLRTGALLVGKALANTLLGLAIVLAALIGSVIMLLVQGKVPITLGPFALVWGLLLTPTFLMWTAFVSAAFALTGNRYGTYAIGLGVMVLTGWLQMRDKMSWAFNWDLWSATLWSDISRFELDRLPVALNRLMVLGLFVLFSVVTIRLFSRRERDATRNLHRLRPQALLGSLAGLIPFAIVPVACSAALLVMVHQGWEGNAAKKQAKDYWKKNVATWLNAPVPALAGVDLDLKLEPARRSFEARGFYDLVNQTERPLAKIPLTGGTHWEKVRWTMNGAEYRPEDRARLYVFTPPRPLEPGERVRIGFAYRGRVPSGISKNGGGRMEFILPSSIVLTGFGGPTIAPQIGYLPEIGVEREKNASDPKEYAKDFYVGRTPAGIAMAERWFDCHLRVTVPADLQVRATGHLVHEEVKGATRVTEWRSDHPVRIFNVVAGRWKEKRGDGAVVAYDPRHPYNVDEMLLALEGARKWFGEWFAPYPWQDLRLSEFAGLAQYAQAPPTNITFSENIGFLTRSRPKANAAFWITAHEAAHQWWPNIAMAGDGPGTDVLSEGMAHFSTILLTEQVKGLEQRMAFCKQIEDRYGNIRVRDSERPMVEVDGNLPGDRRIIYDKGGWVLWMLFQHMGRERGLAAHQDYIRTYRDTTDHPVLQDYLAVMRRHALDPVAFDAFVRQWFFEVHAPQYLVTDAVVTKSGSRWEARANVENIGSGVMEVPIAAARGKRFGKVAKSDAVYRDSRTAVRLAKGERASVRIACDFEPERVVVDPDVTVLMLERTKATAKLAKAPAGALAARAPGER